MPRKPEKTEASPNIIRRDEVTEAEFVEDEPPAQSIVRNDVAEAAEFVEITRPKVDLTHAEKVTWIVKAMALERWSPAQAKLCREAWGDDDFQLIVQDAGKLVAATNGDMGPLQTQALTTMYELSQANDPAIALRASKELLSATAIIEEQRRKAGKLNERELHNRMKASIQHPDARMQKVLVSALRNPGPELEKVLKRAGYERKP